MAPDIKGMAQQSTEVRFSYWLKFVTWIKNKGFHCHEEPGIKDHWYRIPTPGGEQRVADSTSELYEIFRKESGRE